MNINTNTLFLCILLSFMFIAGWAQPTSGMSSPHLRCSKPVLPEALRITEHEDTPNSCLNLEWNRTNAVWDSSALDTYEYFPNGNRSRMLVSLYDLGAWEDGWDIYYTYNNADQPISYHRLDWSGVAWDSVEKYLLEWDPQGNLTLQMHFTWNGSGWDSTSGDRYSYVYHNGNLIAEQIFESYHALSHTWRPQERFVYHYNPQNERDTITYFYDNNGNWEPYERLVDVVYHNLQEDQFASYRYQEFTGTWDDVARFHYTYSQFDSYVELAESYSGSWDSSYKSIVEMDAEGHQISEERFAYNNGWEFFDGNKSHFTYDSWGRTLEEWTEYYADTAYENGSKRIYESFFVVGAPSAETIKTSLEIWPNPCSEALNIRPEFATPTTATISLYDLTGNLRWQSTQRMYNSTMLIQVPETLSSGSYLLEVTSPSARWIQNVTVMR